MERNRSRPGRHALIAGLTVSLLLHVLILGLNPAFRLKELRQPVTAPRQVTEGLPLLGTPVPVPGGQEVVAATTTSPAAAAATPADRAPAAPRTDAAERGPATRHDETAAARLRYRPGAVWAPVDSVPETLEECRARVIAERLRAGVADSQYGAVPAAPSEAQRRFEVGIRIPLGRKRPPPARVEPAPLPDSIRPWSQQRDTLDPRRARRYSTWLDPQLCLEDTSRIVAPRLRTDSASRP